MLRAINVKRSPSRIQSPGEARELKISTNLIRGPALGCYVYTRLTAAYTYAHSRRPRTLLMKLLSKELRMVTYISKIDGQPLEVFILREQDSIQPIFLEIYFLFTYLCHGLFSCFNEWSGREHINDSILWTFPSTYLPNQHTKLNRCGTLVCQQFCLLRIFSRRDSAC